MDPSRLLLGLVLIVPVLLAVRFIFFMILPRKWLRGYFAKSQNKKVKKNRKRAR